MDELNIQAAADAFTVFLEGLQNLEDQHGPEPVIAALKLWRPFSEMDRLTDETDIDDVGPLWFDAGAEIPERDEQYMQEGLLNEAGPAMGLFTQMGRALWSKVLKVN